MRGTGWINGQGALKATWIGMRVAGRYSRRIGGWLAARLWFTPWQTDISPHARAREEAWLQDTEPLAVPFRGGELRGFQAGRGPTVLLVHGWGERASTMGAFVAPLTGAGYHVAAIDLPGHGETTVTETNLYVVAEALQHTAARFGPLAGVVAHSMGGMATVFALSRGLDAEKVVLLAPAVRLDAALSKFNSLFAVPERAAAGLRAHIERRFGPDVWWEFAGDRLAEGLELPVLIVHDDDDPQVDPDEGRRLAEAWRGSKMIATQGLGHVKIARDPSVLADAVDFLTVDLNPDREIAETAGVR